MWAALRGPSPMCEEEEDRRQPQSLQKQLTEELRRVRVPFRADSRLLKMFLDKKLDPVRWPLHRVVSHYTENYYLYNYTDFNNMLRERTRAASQLFNTTERLDPALTRLTHTKIETALRKQLLKEHEGTWPWLRGEIKPRGGTSRFVHRRAAEVAQSVTSSPQEKIRSLEIAFRAHGFSEVPKSKGVHAFIYGKARDPDAESFAASSALLRFLHLHTPYRQLRSKHKCEIKVREMALSAVGGTPEVWPWVVLAARRIQRWWRDRRMYIYCE